MINRKFFFDYVRAHLFDGTIKPAQQAGLTSILDEWEAHHATDDDRWLAYMLGTTHHETGRAMQPIHEKGGDSYFTALYDIAGHNPANAKKNGNTTKGDGPRYHGRGFVQLTWKNNYARMSQLIGVDLVAQPDRALELGIATRIMFEGMQRGLFTGKKLGDYFNPTKEDWINARRIINGLDRAELVASYARAYYAAISYTTG